MANKADRATALIIDGKTYTKQTFPEAEARKIPYLVYGSLPGDDSTYGFKSKATMKGWFDKNNLREEYEQGERMILEASRELTPKEEAEIRGLQTAAVEEETNRLNQAMAKAGVKPGDLAGLRKLLTQYDPLRGPIIHSAVLWEHAHYGGRPLVLPGGWAYPNLGWFAFDKMTSSVFVLLGRLYLFVDTRCRGGKGQLLIKGNAVCNYEPDLNGPFWWFNDDASSALVY
jgi:hypothetical protein